jgi:hypothetical protein
LHKIKIFSNDRKLKITKRRLFHADQAEIKEKNNINTNVGTYSKDNCFKSMLKKSIIQALHFVVKE